MDASFHNKWGTNRITAYFPSIESGKNVARGLPSAPYPAVVFAHAFAADKQFYKWIGNSLASSGYVACLFNVPGTIGTAINQWTDGISDCIAYLDELSTSETSVLKGMVDQDRIGAMGHSMGGAAAIEAAAKNTRIKATVALAPANSKLGSYVFAEAVDAAKSVEVPVQIQVGSQDRITPKDLVHQYYVNIPGVAAKEYVEINGGTHIEFTDGINILVPYFDLAGTLGLDRQHQISNFFFAAWFEYFLRGDHDFEANIFGPRASSAKATGELSALEWVKP
jgi:predicted dienelactone hydrolase